MSMTGNDFSSLFLVKITEGYEYPGKKQHRHDQIGGKPRRYIPSCSFEQTVICGREVERNISRIKE